ncbi:unnamed protein product [Brassica oleracea var. botrytis]
MDQISQRVSSIMRERVSSMSREELEALMTTVLQHNMIGRRGSWYDFLRRKDRMYGHVVTDPSSRPPSYSEEFLSTLHMKHDLRVIALILNPCMADVLNFILGNDRYYPDSSLEHVNVSDMVRRTLTHEDYPLYYLLPYDPESWVVTGGSNVPRAGLDRSLNAQEQHMGWRDPDDIISLCTDMVLCEDGTEAPIKVFACTLDQVVLVETFLVLDQPVADYRTETTGLTAADVEGHVALPLAYVQATLRDIISLDHVLVGHHLNEHLEGLKMYHARIIDTSLFMGDGPRRTLRQVKNALGLRGTRRVQLGCKAAAKNVLAIIRGIQSGRLSLPSED